LHDPKFIRYGTTPAFDGRTGREMDRQTHDSICRASIAYRGKNISVNQAIKLSEELYNYINICCFINIEI